MAVYNIGDKVTLRSSPSLYPSISRFNGHILVVSDKINFGGDTMYSLRWEKEDNPGRICELYMKSVICYEGEIRPYFNTPKDMIIKDKGLPDI